VPPLAIASFYLHHERDRLDDFLFPFLLGTLAAYALLPHFPVEGPRFAFGGVRHAPGGSRPARPVWNASGPGGAGLGEHGLQPLSLRRRWAGGLRRER